MLDKEIAKRWIDELKSGRWVCTTEKLGVPETNRRCCLGVLQEIAPKDLPRNPLHLGAPTEEIWEWAVEPGIDVSEMGFRPDQMAELNDEYGEYPIDLIAKYAGIER